jgi:hypothetical protein
MSPVIRPSSAEASTPAIAGIDVPPILQYFAALNAGEFQRVSGLFAIDGALQPPFDAPIVGREAIAAYLNQEARGFMLHPQSGMAQALDNGCTEFDIVGQVQTPWFSVNVKWTFILSPAQEIFLVKVKLLASLKELLPLRDCSNTEG